MDESRYAADSFLIGTGTIAALNQVPDSLIKTLGRYIGEFEEHVVHLHSLRHTMCGTLMT